MPRRVQHHGQDCRRAERRDKSALLHEVGERNEPNYAYHRENEDRHEPPHATRLYR